MAGAAQLSAVAAVQCLDWLGRWHGQHSPQQSLQRNAWTSCGRGRGSTFISSSTATAAAVDRWCRLLQRAVPQGVLLGVLIGHAGSAISSSQYPGVTQQKC